MVKPSEGHVFQNPANQLDFHRAVEAFFARYLGGRSSTPDGVLVPLMQAD